MKKSNRADIAANRKSTALWAGLSFVLPAAVMLIILAVCRIAPFGNETLINDSNAAWFDSFCRLYESVTEGESIFYHFNTGFGSSFYFDFVSGLCTPFMFAALFFSSERLAAAYSIITVLRAAFSGFFAWFALNKVSNAGKPFSFALACGYALCGFTACAAYYPSIADGAVFFPLFVLGIYSYVNESRPLELFVFGALFFITCSGLFISGIIIAFVFYSAFYYRRDSKRQRAYRLVMFAATIFCAAATAAVLIIPTGAAYYNDGFFASIHTADLTATFCFGGYGTSAAEGTYYLCLAGLLIMGIFSFMLNKKINLGERLCIASGIVLILLSASIGPLGTVLLGFCGVSGEFANIGFMLAMIAVYCTARNLAETEGIRLLNVGISAAAFALLSAISFVASGSDVFAIIAEGGVAAIFTAIFIKLSYDRRAPSVQISAVAATAMILFGVMHCGATIGSINSEYPAKDFAVDSFRRSTLNEEILNSENSVGRSMGFFRYRSTDATAVTGVNLNRNKIAGFTEFANRLGIKADGTAGGGENFTPLTDILFSVSYLVENDCVSLIDNAVLSPAYIVTDSENYTPEGSNAFEFQNDIALKWFGAQDIFTPTEYTCDNSFTSAENERYKWIFGNETTSVTKYTVEVGDSETLYMLAEGGDYMFAVNDDSRSAWQKGCEDGIYTLASFDNRDVVEVYISADTGADLPEPIFMVMTDESAGELSELASERGGTYISRRGNAVKFMLNTSDQQLAVTSIPYEYGWEITVNGEKVEPVAVCEGLIGIRLNKGSNSIVMEYQPPFFKIGMIVSVIMFILGVYIAVYTEHEISRRRKVRMAFKAVEINLNRQSNEAVKAAERLRIKEDSCAADSGANNDINMLSDDEEGFYEEL